MSTRRLLLTSLSIFTLAIGSSAPAQAEPLSPNGWDYLTQVTSGFRTQQSTTGFRTQQQVAGDDCAGGEIYDDGTPENGYSGNPGIISRVEIVQLFNPSSSSLFYAGACIAFLSLSGSDLDLEIVAFQNSGGTPGAEIASLAESVTAIPNSLPGEWYGFDITSMGLNVTQPIFVGVRYNPMAFPSRFTLSDESAGTTLHTGFVNFHNPDNWQTTQSVFPAFRAQLIRLVVGEPVPVMPSPALLAALLGLLLVAATRFVRRTTHA